MGKKVALLKDMGESDESPLASNRSRRASSKPKAKSADAEENENEDEDEEWMEVKPRSRKASSKPKPKPKPKAKRHEEEEEESPLYTSGLLASVDENDSQVWGRPHSQQNSSFDDDIFSLDKVLPNVLPVLPHKDAAATTVVKRKRAPRPNPAASSKQRRNELAEDVPDAKALLADPAFAFLKGL